MNENRPEIASESFIEEEYQNRIRSMSPCERVARSAAMFQWTREQIARQIILQSGPAPPARLKWLVALRLYGHQPEMKKLIESELANVSG